MTISVRTGLAGLALSSLLVISGCSDSSSSNETPIDDQILGETPGTESPDGSVTPGGSETPDSSVTPGGSETSDGSVTPGGSETLDDSVIPDGSETSVGNSVPDDTLPDFNAGDFDASGGDDDSPTAVETASLAGPSIKDTSRSAGPPSTPSDLTLLLSSQEWLEFSWAPSSDDQAVVAYEIYRDGSLIATVEDSDYEHDKRSWLSTSFIDCNYTRYTDCVGDRVPVPGASYSYTVAAVDNEGMSSEQSEPAVFTFEQFSSDAPDLAGYEIKFEDQFEGDSLDITKWKTVLPWGPDRIVNGETQYFVNIFAADPIDYNPFEFTGTTMKITGKQTPSALLEAANNQPYMSGVITTSDNFKMTYGYVEMSARLAGGEGLLSTFYLFNQDYLRNKPEIDIVEYIGGRPEKSYQTYHYYDSNRIRVENQINGEKHSSPTMESSPGINLSAGFHTYGVLWEPELVVWYVDGEEVHRMSGVRVSDEPMNIVAHLVVGSSWIGAPSADVIPAEFEIDYIKAWQKP